MEMLSPNFSGDRANQSLRFALMETGLQRMTPQTFSSLTMISVEAITASINADSSTNICLPLFVYWFFAERVKYLTGSSSRYLKLNIKQCSIVYFPNHCLYFLWNLLLLKLDFYDQQRCYRKFRVNKDMARRKLVFS